MSNAIEVMANAIWCWRLVANKFEDETIYVTNRTLRKLGCGTRRNKALGWLCEMASALGEK